MIGMVDQAFHFSALVFVSGYLLFVAGLAIVYFTSVVGGWLAVVTVLGWLPVFSGLYEFRLGEPFTPPALLI